MFARRALLTAIVATGLVLSACASRVAGQSPRAGERGAPHGAALRSTGGAKPAATRGPLTVQIVLDETTVRAGQPISGTVIVTNSTSHAVTISDCNGGWLQVGLTNAEVGFNPGWLGCLSVPGTVLPVGTTRQQIHVYTTYQACSQDAQQASDDAPVCLAGPRMPPLPPGKYVTKAVMLQPDDMELPTPPPTEVTLTS